MATFTNIGNGEWGVKLEDGDEARQGAQVVVKKKNGEEKTVTLDTQVGGRTWRIVSDRPRQFGQPQRVYVPAEAAQTAFEQLRARLDPDQRSVLTWNPGRNAVVVAAAGSGKTTTTVALVADLVRRGVAPERLVVTTFTNKAGKELQERLLRVLPQGQFDRLQVGTFHSLLRKQLCEVDPLRWDMRKCVDANARTRTAQTPPSSTLWIRACDSEPIGLLGGQLGVAVGKEVVGEYRLAVEAECLSKGLSHDNGRDAALNTQLPRLYEAWGLYEEQKRACGAWDFSDVLFAGRELLRTQYERREHIVIVDEAQDNSQLQIELARLMAGPRGNVLFVGDVRQSIYGWRGAAPDLFRNAESTLNAQPFYLPNNYRSGRKIVELGNRISEGKTWTLGPPARAARNEAGHVNVTGYADSEACAEGVAREVAREVNEGERPDSFAVLCRTRAEQGLYEAALLIQRVPVAIVGGSSFFGSRVWKDFSALLKCVSGTADADTAKRALLTVPAVGLRTADSIVRDFERSHDLSAAVAIAANDTRTRRNTVTALTQLHAFLRKVLPLAHKDRCMEAAQLLCGFAGEEQGDNDTRGELTACGEIAARFETCAEAIAFAARCEGAAMALAEDADETAAQGRVCISTIHKAKGREWKVVYADVSARRFPHVRCTSEKQLDEEERLFYVVVTRAADSLRLSYCYIINGKNGGPSQFLDYVEDNTLPPGGGEGPHKTTLAQLEADTLAVAEKHHGADEVARVLYEDQFLPDPAGVVMTRLSVAAPERPFASPEALKQALTSSIKPAEALTAQGVQPEPGKRYVPVCLKEFYDLLGPVGFVEDADLTAKTGQRVLGFTLTGGSKVVVYTSIPANDVQARELGEDSIRFGLLNAEGKPLMKRQPYSARTKNWRSTTVSRLLEVVSRFGGPCEDCGGPTVEKPSRNAGEVFHSCAKFPDCKGYGPRSLPA